MPDDPYDDGGDSGAPPTPDQEGSASQTCLLPKTCFPDAQPGDTIKVEVVAVHDDEIEVQPQGEDKDDQGGGDEDNDAPPSPASPGTTGAQSMSGLLGG